MHYLKSLGSKSIKINYRGRIMSFIIVMLLFTVFLFVKAEMSKNNMDIGYEYGSIERDIATADIYNVGSDLIYEREGVASWYGKRFQKRRTASGELYDMYKFTAAHKKAPFGTILRVTNKNTEKTVLIRVNDRGPFMKKRILDLSFISAKHIDGIGLPEVKIEGFLPNAINNLDENFVYFFGYSYDYPLVCLPGSIIEISDSCKTFEEALLIYDNLIKQNTGNVNYLFVNSKMNDKHENTEEYNYFIGRIELINQFAYK